jgi:hypothetical protein
MTVVAFAGVKHSPGASTLATAVAATAHGLVIEADPAGGDLAIRAGVPVEPGLASMAIAARSHRTTPLLSAHSQELGSGVRLIAGPLAPRLAESAIRAVAGTLAVLLAADRAGLSAVDIGRIDTAPAVAQLLDAADHRVLVLRATAEDVAGARDRVTELREHGPATVAVVARGQYSVTEIADALEVSVHSVAWDPRAAALLATGHPLSGWLARSPLMRSAQALADQLRSCNTLVG